MFSSLPTVSAIWIGGLGFLLAAISVATGSIRHFENENIQSRIGEGIFLGVMVVFAWVVFGVPSTFIFGGEEVYQEAIGSWTVIIGVLASAFAFGLLVAEVDADSGWERVAAPLLFVAFAIGPALVLALIMGIVAVGVAFWLVLGAVIVALVSFATFGPLAVLFFSPLVILFIVAAIGQS